MGANTSTYYIIWHNICIVKHKNINDQIMNNEEIKEKANTAQTANETANAENNTENTSEANTEACDNKEQAAAEEKTEEKDPLQKAQEELETLKDKYLRTVAEFDNYRKRSLKEKTELVLNGGEKTITAILPVLDDMERAVANADKADSVKAVEEGWELIFKKLRTILEGLGVKKIDTDDKEFDVDFHEAIAMVPGMGDDKKGKVVDCVQTGYTLNDKVIRHAKVAVGQ